MFYLVLIIIAFIGIISHQLKAWFATANEIRKARITPPVSILAPAYNEEKTIIENINSLLKLNYGEFEVIIINDGSSDSTLQKITDEFLGQLVFSVLIVIVIAGVCFFLGLFSKILPILPIIWLVAFFVTIIWIK